MLRSGLRSCVVVCCFLTLATVLTTAADKKVARGTWGGEHAVLKVTAEGASVELDCANAAIDKPLVVDGDGNFRVEGALQVEHAGPVRDDEAFHGTPATFEGHVSGDAMTLTMQISGQEKQTFRLQLHNGGRLRKCN